MNFVTLKDLLPLVPEIIILFTSFIVILVDLFAPKKNRMTTLAVTSLAVSYTHLTLPTKA